MDGFTIGLIAIGILIVMSIIQGAVSYGSTRQAITGLKDEIASLKEDLGRRVERLEDRIFNGHSRKDQ